MDKSSRLNYDRDNNNNNSLVPEFDKSKFPIIYVHFKKAIDSESFQTFLEKWMECYNYKKDFTFVFNLQNLGWVNPSYCYKLAKFMKSLKLRQQEYPHLKRSIVVLQNTFIRSLVSIVFRLQPPQSHVFLAPDMIHANGILRGNREFINSCVDFPPDQNVNFSSTEKLEMKKIESTINEI